MEAITAKRKLKKYFEEMRSGVWESDLKIFVNKSLGQGQKERRNLDSLKVGATPQTL